MAESSLSEAEIVQNGQQWNIDWIKGEGADHWLSSCWKYLHGQSPIFVETSCEVTAAAIRWKSGLGNEWALVEGHPSFEEIETFAPYFQIAIGDDWANCEHIVTIWNGYLIQSYYNKYMIKSSLVNDELRAAFNHISTPGSYSKITQSDDLSEGMTFSELKTYYWVPPNN